MFFVLFEPWNPGVEMCAKYIMSIHIPPGTEKNVCEIHIYSAACRLSDTYCAAHWRIFGTYALKSATYLPISVPYYTCKSY